VYIFIKIDGASKRLLLEHMLKAQSVEITLKMKNLELQ